jgi:hypothetical protein
VLLLAGSATNLLGGAFHPGGTWTTSTFGAGTNSGTSLTVNSAGVGVGAYTSPGGNVVNYTTWSGTAWSAPAAINAGAVAMGQPFLDAAGGATAHLTYQDNTFHFFYLAYSGGSWSLTPQSIGSNYGPVPATIAARGADATVAFTDGQSAMVNDVAAADLTGGSWQARVDATGPESFSVPAVIIPLSSGPELLMVFEQNNGPQMMFATRTLGTWSAPTALPNCLTNDRPALAPMPNGGAILAFRGTDTNLYWALYAGGAWAPVQPFTAGGVSVTVPPAVTHGVGGATAEIAYGVHQANADQVLVARLFGAAWSAPTMVESSAAAVTGVAIASWP